MSKTPSAKPSQNLSNGVPERRRAPLAGSLPPAPAERPPAAQTSRATFARCREKPHKNRLFSPSQGKRGAILHRGLP
ncbi:hypothetical protein PSI23_15240 [Xenorhabdus sp. XENO-10]|uniref:Uncharacterized protein n=1 Tax=Xenorhabdus yunnanensis TaxID=3025878 RepID=A0ABT5LHL3_9GAMM|nr:hypothetical protein [Xenorhabdus yunnanensis]MDC9590603.1 hypothetical protein [Xenorhabdus yunnanensis]